MKNLILFILFYIYSVKSACSDYTSCSDCVQDLTCGWCLKLGASQCLDGNKDGPSSQVCEGDENWLYTYTGIISSTSGYPVTPEALEVVLLPGEELKIQITVTPPESDVPLDLVLLQDNSGSMSDDAETLVNLVPKLVNNMIAFRKNTHFGLATFVEKPLAPMGFQDRQNWVFQLEHPLDNDFSGLHQSIKNIVTHENNDVCEASLDAILMAAVCSSTGWRSNSQKVMVVMTDACYHKAKDTQNLGPGDGEDLENPGYIECDEFNAKGQANVFPGGSCPYTLPPNDLNCEAKRWDDSDDTSIFYLPGTGEDYPTEQDIKSVLAQNNILPIFAITNSPSTASDEKEKWQRLVDIMGFGIVAQLDSDSGNLIDVVNTGLAQLGSNVKLFIAQDTEGYIQSFTPLQYENVALLQPVTFNVTLYSDSGVVDGSSIVFTALGYGQTVIKLYSKFPCVGCDGIKDSNLFLDICGECGGDSDCLDCNGVPYGGAIVDVCNVCQGDGTTCLDCLGVIGDAIIDQCGICNGDNDCTGCDGLPPAIQGDPPLEYDDCGVCDGNNECLDCAGVPNGDATLDLCGECNGENLCVGCDGVIVSGARTPITYDICGICGGDGSNCTACDGSFCDINNPSSCPKLDLCGVCDGTNDCVGCLGGLNGEQYDACGVCDGDSTSCLGCDGIPNSGATFDLCGVCKGSNSCIGCDGLITVHPFNPPYYDQCGVCGGDGTSCLGCDGIPNSGKVYDDCLVCGGTDDCVDCSGSPYGTKMNDRCNICDGDDSSCVGCDGVVCLTSDTSCKITLPDDCGVCGGNNTCKGCFGEIPDFANGETASLFDRCNVCDGNDDCLGCDGVPFSNYTVDLCGVCVSSDRQTAVGISNYTFNFCLGCDNVPFSGNLVDDCGICGGENQCLDCANVPFGTSVFDLCNVCGGDNTTCFGCDGLKYDNIEDVINYDVCGVCDGDGRSCRDCADQPFGTSVNDLCGVCNGENECLDCEGVPFGSKVRDLCNICGGDNSVCFTGCDKQLYSTKVIDLCGVCGGSNNTCNLNPQIINISDSFVAPIIEESETFIESPVALGAGAIAAITLICLLIIVLAIILIKRFTSGALWYIPNAFLDSTGVAVNPLYATEGEGQNPLYEAPGV